MGWPSEAIKEKLRKALPAEASVKNPIDVIGDAPPKRYADSIDIAFEDPDIHGALVLVTPQAQTEPENVAKLIVDVQKKYPEKLIVTAFMGGDSMIKPAEILNAGNISNYDFPEPAIQAMRAVCDYAKVRASPACPPAIADVCGFDDAKIKRITDIFNASKAEGRYVLYAWETSEIFTLIGVTSPISRLATTPEEAGKLGEEMSYPIVMKIASPQIMHKSDCGGVVVGVKDKAAAAEAFKTIMENAKTKGPKGAELKGVEIQQMVDFKKEEKSTELILGMNRDPNFGPMIMVGQGGIFANYIKDVAFDLSTNYDEAKALKQLKKTKIYSILEGVRG